MSRSSAHRIPTRRIQIGASLVLAAAVTGLAAAPASAHTEFVGSTPESGEVLAEAPTEVSVSFDSELLDMGAAIRILDAEGTDWAEGEPTVSGESASIDVSDELPADTGFQIIWRVVAEDGHPISGTIPFAVGDADPLEALPDSVGGSGSADPDSDSSSDAADSGSASASDGSVGRTVLIGVGGAALALAVFLLITFLRRRRT